MRTLLVNVSDSEGGAARVTQRLHREFLRTGVESRYLVQYARAGDPQVIAPERKMAKLAARLRPEVDALPLRLYRTDPAPLFSPSVVPDYLRRTVGQVRPDIVHLNWICKGFVRVETIGALPCPVVWTLHDSWGFTGGCHVPGDCSRYRSGCGGCPQLGSRRRRGLSRWVYHRKARAFRKGGLTVVCPSSWLAASARTSPALEGTRIEIIPNGIDTDTFKPIDKGAARAILGLPAGPRIILFGAMGAVSDPNKGFRELADSLGHLSRTWQGEELLLVVFGGSEPTGERAPLPVRYLGRMFDDVSLCVLYSAADVFVAPSRQENLPTTVMEAMSCGTPTVAFNCSGFPDLVRHEESGFLAAPYDPADLARGIGWVLADSARARVLGAAARRDTENRLRIQDIASRYRELYQELIDRERRQE